MKTYTIKEALLDDSDTTPGFVYVVRDNDFIFYVGISQDPTFRLCQHLGIADAWRCNYPRKMLIQEMEAGKQNITMIFCSSVGSCIRENAPESLSWSFDIYEKSDAIEVTKRAIHGEELAHALLLMERDWYKQRKFIESTLIQELKPCFNRTMNNHHTLLPERYIHGNDITNEGVILDS